MNPYPKGTMLHAHREFTDACRGLAKAVRDSRPWWLIWRVPHLADVPGRTMVRLDKEVRDRLARRVRRTADTLDRWLRP